MKTIRFLILISFLLILFIWNTVPAATVDTVAIHSKSMQKDLKAVIVKPDPQRTDIAVRYPVLYLLHGWSGSYRDWSSHMDLAPLADKYQVIIVCPDGAYAGWYINSPINKDLQYETFISREVVQYMDQHYATLADVNHRAICGLSMGGHGAISLICKYPDVFGAAGSMSGVMELNEFEQQIGISEVLGSYDNNQLLWEKNSCLYLVYKLREKNKGLIFDCGIEDFYVAGNRKIHQKLMELKIPHEYYERPGSHTWDYWVNVLEYHLLFFNKFWQKTGNPG